MFLISVHLECPVVFYEGFEEEEFAAREGLSFRAFLRISILVETDGSVADDLDFESLGGNGEGRWSELLHYVVAVVVLLKIAT